MASQISRPQRSKPKGFLRRVERAIMGAFMTIMAFVLEKIVMRAMKKDGRVAASAEPTQIVTKGGAIDFEPER
jgi:hypothetical protein